MADVRVRNEGSVMLFVLLTPVAREWVDANMTLESWQWFGCGVVVDPRYAENIALGMSEDGLEVV